MTAARSASSPISMPSGIIGKFYIETPEQVCNVLRTQVDVVLTDGVAVLNADDPLVAKMAEFCDGEVMYFARHADSELIAAHLQRGGQGSRAARWLHQCWLPVPTGSELIKLAHVPLLENDRDAVQDRQCSGCRCGGLGARYYAGADPRRIGDIRSGTGKYKGYRLMEVSRIRALRGPNLWSRHTSIEAIVTCSEAEQDIASISGFEQRFRALFPEIASLQLAGHKAAVPLAHVLQLAALGLQTQAGCPVTFSRTTSTLEPGVYQVVVEYSEESVGRKAFELAQQLCHAALHNTGFDLAAALAELRELDEDERLGPSTGSIVQAAVARGIPFRRLTRGSLVQFGWGSKQRRIQAAETDRSSAIAEIDRPGQGTDQETARCGRRAGAQRPPGDERGRCLGRVVRNRRARGGQAAGRQSGQRRDGQYRQTANDLDRAYAAASEISSEVLVERYHSRQRFPSAGGRRPAGCRSAPRSAAGDRRRRAYRARTGRTGQQRPAPRRRACHLADQDPLRRDCPGLPRRSRAMQADSVPNKGARVHAAQQRQPQHRRLRDRCHRRRSSGPGGQRGRCGADGRTGYLRCRRGVRQRAPARWRNRAAASSKSMPRRDCACTCSLPLARGARWARRSSR